MPICISVRRGGSRGLLVQKKIFIGRERNYLHTESCRPLNMLKTIGAFAYQVRIQVDMREIRRPHVKVWGRILVRYAGITLISERPPGTGTVMEIERFVSEGGLF
ncbi:uncharacterized protein BBA_09032 [Beauveria bassiana ARSEF 2860]|uniref:Uncharacterized protein n=1 Tax=Beauveria bassiana (strain ARSEF 2860) TaxID=655819 RepID=J4KLC9_BEAB2|nr:uncharacterized protein BBA_09032 [Beauveria bassiana ARSEF 2860]EJP61984.1 hypothetical protein BBA_09032 [Beauveria bassiana ARSEF 2860]